jgi:hypothetical protein
MTTSQIQKFRMVNVTEYMVSKGYTPETKKSQYSVLSELYNLVVVCEIQENFTQIMTRLNLGKSQKNCQTRSSIIKNFLIYQNGLSLTPAQNFSSAKTQTFEEAKADFKEKLYAFVEAIGKAQDPLNPTINKVVSMYLREGKQLVSMFGYLSEKQLMETAIQRFNAKAQDVEKVREILSISFGELSTKKWLDLPKQGEFMDWLKSTQTPDLKNLEYMEKQFPEVKKESYKPENNMVFFDPKYIWVNQEEREIILVCLMLNENLWITGKAGLGKSSMLIQFCYEEKIPYIRTACNYEADPTDNFYDQSFDGSKVVYHAQAIGKAFLIASIYGAVIAVQEELNSANEATMITLHSCTDSIRSMETKIGNLSLPQGVKCLIAGTGNIGYKGTSDLTPALQSRLLPIVKDQPTKKFILENIWK